MAKNGFSISQGNVYKKIPESKFTSIYCCSMNNYLMHAIGDLELANIIVPHLSTIESLLSNPACRLIKPLKINYNLIEVLPAGTCFRISQKQFAKASKIPENVTPRAFVKYTYQKNQVPYPKHFIQGKFFAILSN